MGSLRLAILFSLSVASCFAADVIQSRLERTLSTAQDYDSRNVFLNPSALGYQTELNGASVSSSFAYGWNNGQPDEYAFSLAYGYLGFGAEQLANPQGSFSRYDFSLGFPLSSFLYLGTRFSFTSSGTAQLNGVNVWDVGAQIRAASWLSVGFMANNIGEAAAGGTTYPVSYTLSAVAKPLSWLSLTGDVTSPDNNFFATFTYLGMVQAEVARGITVRAGYHSEYQWQGGVAINLDRISVFSETQAGSDSKVAVAGFQASSIPFPSILMPDTALEVEVERSMAEEPIKGNLFSKGRPSSLELLNTLEETSREDNVKAVIVRLDQFPLGLASALEIHEALLKLRGQGKTVEVYLGDAGLKEYLVASAATKIYMAPTGELRFPGLKSERYFIKGTLDKIGVQGEFLAEGEYKSAPEMFTRKDSSPASRSASLSFLKEAERQIVLRLEKARKIDEAKWKSLLKTALFDTQDAIQAGLVDGAKHYPTGLDEIKKSYFVRERLRERRADLALPSRIAVIVAEGDILDARNDLMELSDYKVITPEKIERQLDRVLGDPRTKAIVLRVSSPGGEILASDRIASLLDAAAKKKPLYVSMGDVAASGGYYISMPAKKVFASELTITGSIGVFLGKFNLAGLYKWLDLKKEILGDVAYPGLSSEDRPWSAAETDILKKRLEQFYNGFVTYVASSRHLKKEDALTAAKGRVWLGSETKRLGLTDETRGYLGTLQWVADEMHWNASDYEPWVLSQHKGLFSFSPVGGMGKTLSAWETFTGSVFPEEALRQIRWIPRLKNNPFLYLSETSNLD